MVDFFAKLPDRLCVIRIVRELLDLYIPRVRVECPLFRRKTIPAEF